MAYELKNKVVLITGGAIGIGAYVIDLLLEEGVKHVAFLDILEKKGTERQNQLNEKYGNDKVKYYKCDVTQDEQLFGVFKSCLDTHGYIDIVINNAAIMNDSPALYKKEVLINMTALVTCTFKAIEIMRKDRGGKGGLVVNVSSVAAMVQSPMLPVYFGTKSAVLQFSNCIGMPEYYSKTGVRIVTMCFGRTDTTLVAKENLSNYDPDENPSMIANLEDFVTQNPESAASGLVEACKHGESGSTWLAIANRPVKDITAQVQQAYKILSDLVTE